MSPRIQADTLPPLHRAAYHGDLPALTNLLAGGADPNAPALVLDETSPWHRQDRPDYLATPLMLAAASVSPHATAAAKRLLDHGANPRIESDRCHTAIHFATVVGNARTLLLLLEAGALPDRPTHIPPLCRAAGRGDANGVRLLLRYGASPHPILDDGDEPPVEPASSLRIPLFAAAQGGSGECVRLLLEAGVRIETVAVHGETALMNASSCETVRALVQAGCSLSVSTAQGGVTDHAVDNDFPEAVLALVEAGADVDAPAWCGRTPLLRHCGACEMNATMIRALLQADADVQARGFQGRTALHEAVQVVSGDRFGQFDGAIRALVAAGLDVNVRDEWGSTPLHYALGEEGIAEEAVATLLALGADPDARNNKGQTPRDLAPAHILLR